MAIRKKVKATPQYRIDAIPPCVPNLFLFLKDLGVIKTTFHRRDFNTTWELPTQRVIPGMATSTGDFCYTWEPNR